MSYKLFRLLLSVIGIGALGGFGWTFYDFIQNKADYNTPLRSEDVRKWRDEIPPAPTSFKHHLPEWDSDFKRVHELNVTGYVAPEVVNGGEEPPPPPPPRFSESDIAVAMIISSKSNPGAFLVPSGAQVEGGLPPGNFYSVGDKIRIPAKQNAELKVMAIRDREVDFATLDGEDSFTVKLAIDEVDSSGVLFSEAPEGSQDSIVAPPTTRMVASDEYEIGTFDLDELGQMNDDQIYSAVRTQPARDALQNVRGLRITNIQSGTLFDRVGLKKDDVVLSVNGIPAKDRADLLTKLRDSEPSSTIMVELERRGGQRTLTYRVPRR
ncbi:MAG: PDZ domain-containing protein [Planctomycetes bacterium]|nr:PDZ domain-containing protein [Planctomycetota bacterium]